MFLKFALRHFLHLFNFAKSIKSRPFGKKKRQLVNNVTYLLARQPIKMLKNHYLLPKKLY